MNILIAEDEYLSRTALEVIINGFNCPEWHVVAKCTNGYDVLEQMKLYPVDVILLDIKMPEMDGMELLKILSLSHTKVQIIILSGYNDFDYAQQAIRYQVVDYILKPMNDTQIIETLKKCHEKLDSSPPKINVLDNNSNTHTKLIQNVIQYIDEHYAKQLTLEYMGNKFYMNPSYFSDLFKRETGMNFVEYVTKTRMHIAKGLIEECLNLKIYQIAEHVGYSNPKYFCILFKKIIGVSPASLRKSYMTNDIIGANQAKFLDTDYQSGDDIMHLQQ